MHLWGQPGLHDKIVKKQTNKQTKKLRTPNENTLKAQVSPKLVRKAQSPSILKNKNIKLGVSQMIQDKDMKLI